MSCLTFHFFLLQFFTGETAADRSVENAIGNGEVDRDSLNKALCILIAKVDRFYSKVGHELNLRSLRELCLAVTSASENRIFYSGRKAAVLTPTTNLLTRVSDILSSLGNRPLVHQMLVWPIVCSHFVHVPNQSDMIQSRVGVIALSDTISSLILAESQGLCFNQMLVAPFQTIACSETCSPETREQIVAVLADFVKTKSDRIGSGWKTLFGTLRAVRTSEVDDASVHWTVLDVIGYVYSQSFRELQTKDAALRLITPTYTVILNLFRTVHIANPNLLHRYGNKFPIPERLPSNQMDGGRSDANLRQAVGISTQMVVDILSLDQSYYLHFYVLSVVNV
ncbi:unnamed protein product [Angiostrongylus costaricensis]|uniref:DUF1981 domain-containing protein n=1 Tax=Angiostrongylus costaricensis TaxID=334426 RepID=A0A158PGP8_ANGCS|nr:unnamed protein product [Angiostrongylus costaricensis]